MRENVGGADRLARAVVGPVLLALGYARWGGRDGEIPGLLAMLAGALLVETAATRVCPVNELAGVDSARRVPLG
ncbi:MAG TPA: DUF2892 domain-containing protein [Longimicrobiaceae bacterium]